MPAVQVEETELANLRAVADFVSKGLSNKEARKLLLQARKAVDPNAVIPEIDAAAPVLSQVEELRSLVSEQKKLMEQEAAARAEEKQLAEFRSNWDRQKAALRNAGWRDEGIAEVEKHAQERGIGDLEIAAAHWEKLHPPAEPVQPSGSGSWGFFDQPGEDDKFVKAMMESHGEDESALNAEINATLREVRSQTAAVRR